jgi:hypothetical protein
VIIHDPIVRLLALCTHLDDLPEFLPQIRIAAGEICDWDDLLSKAEEHGIAPLLHYHLKAAGAEVPDEAERNLLALTLRHRLINTIRTRLLRDVFSRCQQAGIEVIALKGAALAYLLYPQVELRPMKDMDLLVDHQDLERVQEIMAASGYIGGFQESRMEMHRHLPPFQKKVEGFTITIEIHHNLFDDLNGRVWCGMKDLTRPWLDFPLGENFQGKAPGYEDMLYHLCYHAVQDNDGLNPLRMIQVADILNFASRFVAEVDWKYIRQSYPFVLNILSAFQYMRPVPGEFIARAGLNTDKPPGGVGEDRVGWPSMPLVQFRQTGIMNILKQTIFPSAWWLYLHYGNNRRAPVWYHWLKHAANLMGRMRWHVIKRIKRMRKQKHGTEKTTAKT